MSNVSMSNVSDVLATDVESIEVASNVEVAEVLATDAESGEVQADVLAVDSDSIEVTVDTVIVEPGMVNDIITGEVEGSIIPAEVTSEVTSDTEMSDSDNPEAASIVEANTFNEIVVLGLNILTMNVISELKHKKLNVKNVTTEYLTNKFETNAELQKINWSTPVTVSSDLLNLGFKFGIDRYRRIRLCVLVEDNMKLSVVQNIDLKVLSESVYNIIKDLIVSTVL